MRAHPRAHWFVLICCLFLFRLHTPHISAEPREAYQLVFMIILMFKVVNDFPATVVEITTVTEVVPPEMRCKFYNDFFKLTPGHWVEYLQANYQNSNAR